MPPLPPIALRVVIVGKLDINVSFLTNKKTRTINMASININTQNNYNLSSSLS